VIHKSVQHPAVPYSGYSDVKIIDMRRDSRLSHRLLRVNVIGFISDFEASDSSTNNELRKNFFERIV
jgi:hypothetical protein